MSRKGWILISLGIALVALVALVFASGAGAAGEVTVSLTAAKSGDNTVLRIVVTNGTDKNLDFVNISGALPQGVNYVSSTPQAKVEGGAVKWFQSNGLAAGMTLSGIEYTVSGAGNVTVKVDWKSGASSGSVTSSAIDTKTAAAARELMRRGCLACHVTGSRYSLINEAEERAKASRGLQHPKVEENNVAVCLGCHAQGAAGVLSLADIVHPSHMASTTFVEHYSGNCYTCHTVGPKGTFELIGDKVDVNDKGIQKNMGPIPSIPSTVKK